MKKSKLAKLAMLGMASSFCLSAQDAATSDHEGEVAMHKKPEKENGHKNGKCGGPSGCNGKESKSRGKCNGKSGCNGKESKCGGPGGCGNKNGGKQSKCNNKGTCNHSSYNDTDEADESYQALRAKRYRNAEGK